MKYRKKPVVVDADRWIPTDPKCQENALYLLGARIEGEDLLIDTLEGTMRASPGDWIIRGIRGEYYPCKHDIFLLTYEKVEDIVEEPSMAPFRIRINGGEGSIEAVVELTPEERAVACKIAMALDEEFKKTFKQAQPSGIFYSDAPSLEIDEVEG